MNKIIIKCFIFIIILFSVLSCTALASSEANVTYVCDFDEYNINDYDFDYEYEDYEDFEDAYISGYEDAEEDIRTAIEREKEESKIETHQFIASIIAAVMIFFCVRYFFGIYIIKPDDDMENHDVLCKVIPSVFAIATLFVFPDFVPAEYVYGFLMSIMVTILPCALLVGGIGLIIDKILQKYSKNHRRIDVFRYVCLAILLTTAISAIIFDIIHFSK